MYLPGSRDPGKFRGVLFTKNPQGKNSRLGRSARPVVLKPLERRRVRKEMETVFNFFKKIDALLEVSRAWGVATQEINNLREWVADYFWLLLIDNGEWPKNTTVQSWAENPQYCGTVGGINIFSDAVKAFEKVSGTKFVPDEDEDAA